MKTQRIFLRFGNRNYRISIFPQQIYPIGFNIFIKDYHTSMTSSFAITSAAYSKAAKICEWVKFG